MEIGSLRFTNRSTYLFNCLAIVYNVFLHILLIISYTGYVLAKEIVSLLRLQLMYNYLYELTGVLFMQPSW